MNYHFKNAKNGEEVSISKVTNGYLTYALTWDNLEYEFADQNQFPTAKSVIQTERIIDVVKTIVTVIKANPSDFAVNELNLLVEFLKAQNCSIELYRK